MLNQPNDQDLEFFHMDDSKYFSQFPHEFIGVMRALNKYIDVRIKAAATAEEVRRNPSPTPEMDAETGKHKREMLEATRELQSALDSYIQMRAIPPM